jgi:dinuclear metal center YbgI/SA1388 family protein
MKLKEICSYLDTVVPISFQESYDNSGLQIGDPENEIKSVMISFEVTENVLDEAISLNCGLIITHHPLIFSPVKKLIGRNHVEKLIFKAVKNDIAIYSSHTNLDIVKEGVSRKMATKLNLRNVQVLSPLKNHLLKLVTYIPKDHLEAVSEAIFNAGAGVIGNYDKCSFSVGGTGSFRGGETSAPFTGDKGKFHFENEIRFETIMLSHLKDQVIRALLDSHPYEEVAYDIFSLENEFIKAGPGCVGELPEPMEEQEFMKLLSAIFDARGVRFSSLRGKKISRVALCGGAGIGFLNDAFKSGADVYITSDIKYHDFFNAENGILLVDIGHYESEKFSTEILYELIIKKFPTFAVRFSETNTNPINYL